jgi:hypothetical protein
VLSSPGKEYRVSWVGFADAEWSWEPEANLASATGAIAAFENASGARGKRRKLAEPHPGCPATVADAVTTNGDVAAPALALTAEVENRGLVRRGNACSSRHKGLSWNKKSRKWKAQVYHSGTTATLGHFATEAEAKACRDARCLELGRDPDAGVSSGFRGVNWNKANSKWQAAITVGGKGKSLGSFAASARGEVDAALAYDAAARTAGRAEKANFESVSASHPEHNEMAAAGLPATDHGVDTTCPSPSVGGAGAGAVVGPAVNFGRG